MAFNLLTVFNKTWLIEPDSAIKLLELWMDSKDRLDYKVIKGMGGEDMEMFATYAKFFEANEDVRLAPVSSYQLSSFKGFEGASVAIIPVSGPMMKADYCGDLGTASMKLLTRMASQAESVQTIIFLNDSPGGTVDGTEAFAKEIKASPKRTVSLIDGMCCSANYWTGSSADEIYATNSTDIIGSIGTMCAWVDNTEMMKAEGRVLREYYATQSKDKNRMMREASAGNGKMLIEQMLDPMNDIFLGSVKDNRAGKLKLDQENVLTGHTYLSERAVQVGLVDGFATVEAIVDDAVKAAKGNTTIYFSNNTSNNTMSDIKTLAELKAAYPGLVQEAETGAAATAVAAERDRVGAWLTLIDADPAAVATGIKGKEPITQTQAMELMQKRFGKQQLQNMEEDNVDNVETDESETGGGANQAAAQFSKELQDEVRSRFNTVK